MKAISYPDVRVPENTIPSHTAFRSQGFSTPVWFHTEQSKSTKRERHWTVFYYSQAKLILVSQGLVPAYQCQPSEGVGACSGATPDVSNQFLRAMQSPATFKGGKRV